MPEITSKSVVLPAPFGPMSPQIVPRATVNATESSAVIPPKRTVTSTRLSIGDSCSTDSGTAIAWVMRTR